MIAKVVRLVMELRNSLPFIVVAVLYVIPLTAQQNLPKSTQEGLATSARIEVLTASDFKAVLAQGKAGDPKGHHQSRFI